jgi:hypothetical protein
MKSTFIKLKITIHGLVVIMLCINKLSAQLGQCDNITLYPINNVTVSLGANTISTNQYAGDYNVTTSYMDGALCIFGSSISTDYITIRRASDNFLLASGTTPVSLTYEASMGNIEMHINTNIGCGGQPVYRSSTVFMDYSIYKGGSNDGFAFASFDQGIVCPPSTTNYFVNQSQIDLFPNIYPNCKVLPYDLNIIFSTNIFNLDSLAQLRKVEGYLSISDNISLEQVNGLKNIDTILGSVTISRNFALKNLGMKRLKKIDGYLDIFDNGLLSDMSGLDSLNTIGGNLFVEKNPMLPSLLGLDNINPTTITNLTIAQNANLSYCKTANLCNYLSSNMGPSLIFGNKPGCQTEAQIEASCISPCPPGDVLFKSQSEINSFNLDYAGCSYIPYNVNIREDNLNNISNLDSLIYLKQIGGTLTIEYNPLLADLSGLDSLHNINGGLNINHNTSLTTLDGFGEIPSLGGGLNLANNIALNDLSALSTIATVGGNVVVTANSSLPDLDGLNNLTSLNYGIYLSDNAQLTNVNALDKLLTLNGTLFISGNPLLASLVGLDNLNQSSITSLYVQNCPNLSICGVSSICSYLAHLPVKPATIVSNNLGCGSIAEVNTICALPCPLAYPMTTWLGSTNNNWSTPTNWPCGIIPPPNADVMIPNIIPQPIVDINTEVNKLTLSPGTNLQVLPGVTFKIKGN